MLLRLLCAIKCLLYPSLYDSSSADFYANYMADEALVLPSYDEFVNETLKSVAYSDMLTVLCLSTVIQKLIQKRWPITIHTGQESPLAKLAVGQNVQPSQPFFDHRLQDDAVQRQPAAGLRRLRQLCRHVIV